MEVFLYKFIYRKTIDFSIGKGWNFKGKFMIITCTLHERDLHGK